MCRVPAKMISLRQVGNVTMSFMKNERDMTFPKLALMWSMAIVHFEGSALNWAKHWVVSVGCSTSARPRTPVKVGIELSFFISFFVWENIPPTIIDPQNRSWAGKRWAPLARVGQVGLVHCWLMVKCLATVNRVNVVNITNLVNIPSGNQTGQGTILFPWRF